MLVWLALFTLLGVNSVDLRHTTLTQQSPLPLPLSISDLTAALRPGSQAVYIYTQFSSPTPTLKAASTVELSCSRTCISTRGIPILVCVRGQLSNWTCLDLASWLSN
jgi:hypothetical protein